VNIENSQKPPIPTAPPVVNVHLPKPNQPPKMVRKVIRDDKGRITEVRDEPE